MISRFYDDGIAACIPVGTTADALKGAAAGGEQATQWASIQADAGLQALGQVAVLPCLLTVVFLVVFLVLLLNSRSAKSAAREAASAN